MATPDDSGKPDLREWARRAEPPVRYDVEAGLQRHRALVEAKGTLPEWASLPEPSRALSLARWLGLLCLAGGLGLLSWWAFPAPRGPEHEALGSAATAADGAGTVPMAAPEGEPEATDLARQAARGSTVGPVPTAQEPSRLDAAGPRSPGAPAASAADAPERRAPDSEARSAPAPGRPAGQTPQRAAPAAPTRTGAAAMPATATAPPARAPAASPTASTSTGVAGAGEVRGRAPRDGEEIRLLARARKMLHVDPLRSLRLVREGEDRFGEGYLRQERRFVEIQALRALGRDIEADALADWFVQDYPDSPYASQVEQDVER